MFYFSEGRAQIGGKLYSIIETCRLNNISPSKYLEYALTETSKSTFKKDDIVSLLPTSKSLPSELSID